MASQLAEWEEEKEGKKRPPAVDRAFVGDFQQRRIPNH